MYDGSSRHSIGEDVIRDVLINDYFERTWLNGQMDLGNLEGWHLNIFEMIELLTLDKLRLKLRKAVDGWMSSCLTKTAF